MAAADDTGRSRRDRLIDQLNRAERKTKRTKATIKRIAEIEAELAMPSFPTALSYLWRMYLRLRRRCGLGFSGAEPVSWTDIHAFASLSGHRLAPWEIDLIEAVDDLFLARGVTPKKPGADSASANDPAAVKALLRGWKPAKNERGESDG